MDDHPPPLTRAQVAGHVAREALIVVLAFVAGAGAYLAALTTVPLRPQDYAGAIAAGATAALLKLFPTTGGSRG